MASCPPSGFHLLSELDPVMRAFAPLYVQKRDDGLADLGFYVSEAHCNPMGNCHGGVWATLADILMGINVGFITGLSGPTVSLNVTFMGAGHQREWVVGTARVLSHSPRLAFADCLFAINGQAVLRADAVFRRKYPPHRNFADLTLGTGDGA